MRPYLALALILAAVPLIGVTSSYSAPPPAVVLTVACTTNPEKVTVKNNTAQVITVKSVSSIYQPLNEEPFTVNKNVAAGKAITFKFGTGATGPNVPTKKFIFNNDVGTREGAKVVTTKGTFTKRCAAPAGS